MESDSTSISKFMYSELADKMDKTLLNALGFPESESFKSSDTVESTPLDYNMIKDVHDKLEGQGRIRSTQERLLDIEAKLDILIKQLTPESLV